MFEKCLNMVSRLFSGEGSDEAYGSYGRCGNFLENQIGIKLDRTNLQNKLW